jgi:MFS family permease
MFAWEFSRYSLTRMDTTLAASWQAAAPGPERRRATAAVLLGLVVAAFETTVVTTAMPTLTAELHGRQLYAWVFTGFLLASTVGVLVSGRLADQVGRKATFLGGMGLFLLGSVLCGFSTSVPMLVGFRVLQGLGAGAVQPTTLTISSDLYTLKGGPRSERLHRSLGAGLGGGAGRWAAGRAPRLALGVLGERPGGPLAMALLRTAYRDPPLARSRRVDLQAPTLGALAVALLLLALEPHALPRGANLLSALAAVAVAWAFLRQQRRTTDPVLSPAALGDPTVRAGLLGGLASGGILFTLSAYVPLWLIAQAGRSPLGAGVALVPLLLGWAVGSSFGVKLLLRGGLRASAGLGFGVAGVGAAAFGLALTHGAADGWLYASLAFLGFGLGPAASTCIIASQARVRWAERGAVTSAIYACRMLGGSVAIALVNALHRSVAAEVVLLVAIAWTGAWMVRRFAPARPVHGDLSAVPALVE